MRIPSPCCRKRARIEIIPLIDIIFFLLATFVMVSLSMVKNQGIKVNLPSAAASAPQENQDHVVVTVTAQRDIYINKERVPLADFPRRIQQLKQDNPDLFVRINGDTEALWGDTIDVLDEVRKAGIVKVIVQTKKEEK